MATKQQLFRLPWHLYCANKIDAMHYNRLNRMIANYECEKVLDYLIKLKITLTEALPGAKLDMEKLYYVEDTIDRPEAPTGQLINSIW